MPTIIDSLFLELGIDTSKFSADQKRALEKIAQFEKQAKHSAGKTAQSVRTVGKAFRDIADESKIGRSAKGLDTLATKLKALGQAGRVSGGVTGGLGMAAEGIGSLLSPLTLGVAALALLGKGIWDTDKKMTAFNATTYRQAQLSGMSAKNLWSWGEAARTVGAQPTDISGGIASLQTSIAGMMIGAGNATPQLIALSRLGLGWNARSGMTGAQVTQMFERVHQMAARSGFKNLGGLRALTAPIMNDAMFALATSPVFDPSKIQQQIKGMEPADLGQIMKGALESQKRLGLIGVGKDTLMENVYGATHNVFDTIAAGIFQLVGLVTSIWNFIAHPIKNVESVGNAAINATSGFFGKIRGKLAGRKIAPIAKALIGLGLSPENAAALAGNFMQESSLNPYATNDFGAHVGLGQWDAKRQALFKKRFGYQLGSYSIGYDRQMRDQMKFAVWELQNTPMGRQAMAAMTTAKTLADKTNAVNAYYERSGEVAFLNGAYRVLPGKSSLNQNFAPVANRIGYAQDVMAALQGMLNMIAASNARRGIIDRSISNETHVGDIHVHTPSTDPKAHADAVRQGLSTHPLIGPVAQHQVTLSTSAVAG